TTRSHLPDPAQPRARVVRADRLAVPVPGDAAERRLHLQAPRREGPEQEEPAGCDQDDCDDEHGVRLLYAIARGRTSRRRTRAPALIITRAMTISTWPVVVV